MDGDCIGEINNLACSGVAAFVAADVHAVGHVIVERNRVSVLVCNQ